MAILHTYRSDGNWGTETKKLTPVTAIKQFCKECNGYQVIEVAKCETTICPLWPFRQGKIGRISVPGAVERGKALAAAQKTKKQAAGGKE